MEVTVSVIIPTYNRSKALVRAIESVFNQSYRHWELIVVDDFSTDDTAEKLLALSAKDSRVRYISNIIKGANHARNLGMNSATGDFLVFLDSDDELCPRMLEEHVRILITRQEVCLTVSFCKAHWEWNNSEWINYAVSSQNLLLDFLRKKITWPINTVLIRKDFLYSNKINFHTKLLNGQDYCFFLSIIGNKPRIVFIPEVLSINHHLERESKNVKVSAGDTLKYKISRLRSRNIAFGIAIRRLSITDFLIFFRYFAKYQGGLIFEMVRTGFR